MRRVVILCPLGAERHRVKDLEKTPCISVSPQCALRSVFSLSVASRQIYDDSRVNLVDYRLFVQNIDYSTFKVNSKRYHLNGVVA